MMAGFDQGREWFPAGVVTQPPEFGEEGGNAGNVQFGKESPLIDWKVFL